MLSLQAHKLIILRIINLTELNKMRSIICTLLILLLGQSTLLAQIQLKETILDTATIITGLDIPWEIQWGPDDQIWTTERYGRVSRINPETGEQDVILDISGLVHQSSESGLLGMVLHPDFDTEPYVYMAYTYKPAGQILEKIVRYKYEDGVLINEFVLLDNIQGNSTHIGCRLIILPDTTLLITTGDAQNQPAAQDLNHLSGKIHRLNLDGSVPSDNPFPGNPVYSFGHRNAQGLYFAPNSILYSSEHGPSTDDEFNIIEPGRNYGWPNVHGFCDLPSEQDFCDENNVVEPLVAWTPTIATSDIIYYDHVAIPEWEDHILMCTLKNKRLYVLELDEEGTSVIGEEQYFNNWWGRLRDVCMAPDGAIYLSTNGPSWSNTEPFTHKIIKVWNSEYVSIAKPDIPGRKSIKIYPNPAKDKLQVSVDHHFIGQQLRIYSADSKLVFQQTINSMVTTIPLHSLRPGMFVLSLEIENEIVFSEKLFILKD